VRDLAVCDLECEHGDGDAAMLTDSSKVTRSAGSAVVALGHPAGPGSGSGSHSPT
jgi:hypothetical protein